MEQCGGNKLFAEDMGGGNPACSSLIAIIFWNGYSDFYNANPSKSGDNVALTFIKKAVIYFFAAFSCVGIGANIAMMLLN